MKMGLNLIEKVVHLFIGPETRGIATNLPCGRHSSGDGVDGAAASAAVSVA